MNHRPISELSSSSVRRIIFVNRYFHPDISATSQILTDLAHRLVERGLSVHVICCRQLYDDANARLPKTETTHGVRVHRVWTTRFGRARLIGRAVDYACFYGFAAAKLFGLARAGDIVVAKTDPPLISIVAGWVARQRRAQLINWLQDIFPEVASRLGANPLPTWLDAGVRRMRTHSLATARTNVVLGERMREYLLQLHIPADQISVIENWADGEAIRPMATASTSLRRALGNAGRFVVGYSGNMGRAHDFETILDAAAALHHDSDIQFLMIGGGAKMEQLKIEVHNRGIDSFKFLPYQAREVLGDSLAAADVHLACLLPPLEGLIVPSKFYGILAAGRPVIFIGDPDGELARVIRSSGCGGVVNCRDGAALAAEISRLKTEPETLQSAGRRARQLFDNHYTLDVAAAKWLELLRALESS